MADYGISGKPRAEAQAPNDHDLAIVNATVDLLGGTITIQGRNFGPPYVTLNDWNLTVLPGSTDQLIIAEIPAGFDPVTYPGSYRLAVWTIDKNGKVKDGKKDYDQFDMTIGATGLRRDRHGLLRRSMGHLLWHVRTPGDHREAVGPGRNHMRSAVLTLANVGAAESSRPGDPPGAGSARTPGAALRDDS